LLLFFQKKQCFPAASMTGRIAVLVLAHRPESLPYLVSLLPPPFDIFVHYDAKSGTLPQLTVPNLRFISPRRPVFWGGFSMIEATLDLLQTAIAAGGYERYVLLSGDTLALRPPEALAEALLNPNVEYIELVDIKDEPATKGKSWDQIEVMLGSEHPGRFYNFQNWDSLLTNPYTADDLARTQNLTPAAAATLRAEAARVNAAWLSRLPPRPRLFQQFYYGTQWWALTANLIGQILPQLLAKETKDFFRYMEVPDEHYFNCVVGNRFPKDARRDEAFPKSLIRTDPESRNKTRPGITAAFLRENATKTLFIRKFNPAFALEIAHAIRAGRYFSDMLK
jgi:hypothetical protein